jgi:hypothetical protein
MKTPFGHECQFYYADFNRGRSQQECRLIAAARQSEPWQPVLCQTCPVPGILRANACPNLILHGQVVKKWFGFKIVLAVAAECRLTGQAVAEPHVGCGQCHQPPPGWQDLT